MMKMKEYMRANKKKSLIIGITTILIFAGIIAGIVYAVSNSSSEEEIVYRETQAVKGDLTVGITDSSSVEIGTVDQTFDLDISALVLDTSSSSSTSSTTSSEIGGMGGMGGNSAGADVLSQMLGLASGSTSTTSGDDNDLVVDSVCVTVGQQVEEGDSLYTVTGDSTDAIRTQLAADVVSADNELQATNTNQKSTRLTAKQTYDTSIAYGSYAQTEYDDALAELTKAVSDKQAELDAANEELAANQQKLTDRQSEYDTVLQEYNDAQAGVDSVDKYDNAYWYMQYESIRETALSTKESLDDEMETLEDTIEEEQDNIVTLQTDLKQLQIDEETGALTAKNTYDTRVLAYNTAQETYDVTIGYLDEDVIDAQDACDEAQDKLDEFDDNIQDGAVCAQYSGVVTDVPLETGDSITTGSTILTLYDDSDVTMSMTVEEDDMTSIEEGSEVNIVFTAYPDDIFKGTVTDLGDATLDSSTGIVSYTLTITIEGDVSGLYQGMTGDVTIITKETEEVIYVSNRAIFRDGTRSYVKMKDEDGEIIEKDVVTGFSDGVNVEITEGLSEGDTVLIESKVSE